MSTVQTTVRASAATLMQWKELAKRFGSKTGAFAAAIERLYAQEVQIMVGKVPSVWVESRSGVVGLRCEHTPEQLVVAQQVGYHNYFQVGAFEAEALVQAVCPDGWRAHVEVWPATTPPRSGAIRVGQVRCVHGDPDYPLYVYPIAEGG